MSLHITRTTGPEVRFKPLAARRYLLSEIESVQRTDLCWPDAFFSPCQPFLVVPIDTCRTITPTSRGVHSTQSTPSHPHQTNALDGSVCSGDSVAFACSSLVIDGVLNQNTISVVCYHRFMSTLFYWRSSHCFKDYAAYFQVRISVQ